MKVIKIKYYDEVGFYNYYEFISFTAIAIDINLSICFYKNNRIHRKNGPAIFFENNEKQWWYEDAQYGYNNDFTNKTWVKFIKNKKHLEKMEIFK